MTTPEERTDLDPETWADLPEAELIGGGSLLTDRQMALLCAVLLHSAARVSMFDPVTDLADTFAAWLDEGAPT